VVLPVTTKTRSDEELDAIFELPAPFALRTQRTENKGQLLLNWDWNDGFGIAGSPLSSADKKQNKQIQFIVQSVFVLSIYWFDLIESRIGWRVTTGKK